MDQLTASLLDLLHELEGRGIPIMVGGGFGLYMKRLHLAGTGQRTLFDQLPEPRSTNDLDLFLRAEVLADGGAPDYARPAPGTMPPSAERSAPGLVTASRAAWMLGRYFAAIAEDAALAVAVALADDEQRND
jgi:hypothetical protein